MKRTVSYFKSNYENDTAIEYVDTDLYSCLNCSYTSEDPDCGTETMHFVSNTPKSMEQMAYEAVPKISAFLDAYGEKTVGRPRVNIAFYQYNNSTLFAVEDALLKIAKDYHPDKWYATIRDAGRTIARALLNDRTKVFAFCESNREEARGNPNDHKEEGGWYGIRRIPGFFDNEPGDFIVAVGYYGGGQMGFACVGSEDADDSTCEDALVEAICNATGLSAEHMIFVELDEKKEDE